MVKVTVGVMNRKRSVIPIVGQAVWEGYVFHIVANIGEKKYNGGCSK